MQMVRVMNGVVMDLRLIKERTAYKLSLPINEEHNEVIELVVNENKSLDIVKLKELLHKNNIDSSAVYQWQNHYVIFAKVADAAVSYTHLRAHETGRNLVC